MKASQIIGIIIAIVLVVFGIAYPVPEKHVFVSSSSSAYYSEWIENKGAEYLGGDAYNYQVEASLKAGYMSGVLVMKALTFVCGILLFFLSLFSAAKCACVKKQTEILTNLVSKLDFEAQMLSEIQHNSSLQIPLVKKIVEYIESSVEKVQIPEEITEETQK